MLLRVWSLAIGSTQTARLVHRIALVLTTAFFGWALACSSSRLHANQGDAPPADEEARVLDGALVRLPVPISDATSHQFIASARQVLRRVPPAGARPILVIEFATGQSDDGLGSDFHSANRIAEFLTTSPEMKRAKTVAFIPKSVRGHAVLVAMACETIVMARDADLGDAGADEPTDAPSRKASYQSIASKYGTIPPPLALKMLDKSQRVLQVITEKGTQFIFPEGLDDLKKVNDVQQVIPVEDNVFSGAQARELGLVSRLAADRTELARALGLPEAALHKSVVVADQIEPIQLTVEGEITSGQSARLRRTLDEQVKEGTANFLVLLIDSRGGSPSDSQELANYLAALDVDRVHTVAYIPQQAAGDAAIIALACNEIVMHPQATLGGSGATRMDEREIDAGVTAYKAMAPIKSRSWSLGAAMLDPTLKVFKYHNQANGQTQFWSEEEAAGKDGWTKGAVVTGDDGPLRLTGDEAAKLDVAHVVDSFEELKRYYDLQGNPRMVDPTWIDRLLHFLASPSVSLFLLLIGGAAVYAELQTPGVGLGGMIAFICFLLYFWAHFFEGTATALEILLFVSGLGCLVLEIFIFPGMGLFGLFGGAMIIVSLVLASQTFVLPRNSSEIGQMQNSLLIVGGAALGVVAAIAGLRRWLPHAPVFNRMLLEPPSQEELEDLDYRETMVSYEHLIGRSGEAITRLAPSGKARIDDELVDVITAGEFLDRGTLLTVLEARGNRVVVAAAQA
jgi:membrane-bound serine protease (ClpP class)